MTATHFEIPANISIAKLIASLNDKVETHPVSKHYLLKTFYDSFDWRLYREGLICEFNRSKLSSSLTLANHKNGDLIASTLLIDVPQFSNQFNPGLVRQTLQPLLGVRALLPVCTLECETYQIEVRNEDEKIVLRILIEEFDLLNNRLTLFPIKGYAKIVRRLADMMVNDLGLLQISKPVLLDALRLQGRHPKSYSSKFTISLRPEMPAETASKAIFSALLKSIKLNEQGTISDTDSEFLHDYRVAVRRTRVGISQLRHVLPEDVIIRYKSFFSWLSKITGETRDLDVYLLNFEQYKRILPVSIRQSINPLESFLQAKKNNAHKTLANKLRSHKYLTSLKGWENYLTSSKLMPAEKTSTHHSVKELADKRIWQTYQKVIKEGKAINDQSPPASLHSLRKTCKKLRYLMEFFQSLYPENQLDKLIKSLKKLQDVLGVYQDYAVQQDRLQQFSEEMQTINTPIKTFLAMGVLIQDFEGRKSKVRDSFGAQFAAFNQAETHQTFHHLFATKKRSKRHIALTNEIY